MSFSFRELSLDGVDAQKESSGGSILKEETILQLKREIHVLVVNKLLLN